jgi:hypothetical protein
MLGQYLVDDDIFFFMLVLIRSCTLNMVSQHGISFSFSQAFIEAFIGFEVGSLFNHVL